MKVITRAEWGAGPKRGDDVSSKLPWGEVVIHTEAGAQRTPASEGVEKAWIRSIEAFHVGPDRGWNGIAYSFLIAPSGRIFEGRGWGRSGAHTEGRNSTAAGICFLGHGDKWPATDAQWASCRWLIGEGVRLGKLRRRPKISGHKDYSTKGKTCPGTLIYPLLQSKLANIDGPSGPTEPTGPSTETDMSDPAVTLMLTAIEQRLVRIETALNISAKGTTTDGGDPYPVRTIRSLTRIEQVLAEDGKP